MRKEYILKEHVNQGQKQQHPHSIVKLGTCYKPQILLLVVSRLLKDIILDSSLKATPRKQPTTPIALESTSVKRWTCFPQSSRF